MEQREREEEREEGRIEREQQAQLITMLKEAQPAVTLTFLEWDDLESFV